jgi:phosphoglycerate kinase
MLLENTRFHDEEKNNDQDFARNLASLADLYVNDAFGTAHRSHATVVSLPKLFDTPACGFLMEKEIHYLGGLLHDPARPFLAIIGGSKVSTKMHVLFNLVNKVEHLVVGGRMCFTFYRAKQYTIGDTRYERDLVDDVEELLGYRRLYLPDDIVVVTDAKPGVPVKIVPAAHIPHYVKGVDIGPKTREEIRQFIKEANTIVWNGPMGIFEIDDFAGGTEAVALAMAEATERGATTVIGGGETIAACRKFRVLDKMSHVSTGGGASLEFLEGKMLPGIKALKDKE